MPVPDLKALTILSYSNNKVLTLTDQLIFLDRPLDDKFVLIRCKKDNLSSNRFTDYLTKTLDFQVAMATSCLDKKDKFYGYLSEILNMQRNKYSSDFWYLQMCFLLEGVKFSAPIIEHQDLILCVTDKIPKTSIEKNNLVLEYSS